MAGTFLTETEIVQAVKAGQIRIAYYAVRKDGKPFRLPRKVEVDVEPQEGEDEYKKLARAYFLDSLMADSLLLHVGPYALVERFVSRSGRRFTSLRQGQRILNVAEAEKLVFHPGEFILAGSNECVALDGETGGIVLSCIRNTDIALSHVAGPIDPAWEGKLQIGIHNASSFSKSIDFLDPLCSVRFYKLDAKANADTVSKFQRTRPHFGLDWWELEQNPERKMFPMRYAYSVNEGLYTRALRYWRTSGKNRAVKLITAATAVSILLGLVHLTAVALDYRSKLEDERAKFDELKSISAKVDRLQDIQLEEMRFTFESKASTQEIEFQLHNEATRAPSVFTSVQVPAGAQVLCSPTVKKDKDGALRFVSLKLECTTRPSTQPFEGAVKALVVYSDRQH